ncbi:MAG TPA: hypothetical protein GXZ51_04830 [Acholeplasma sp.]|nr:hypothetical protein [Acholeplasma sp.]
MKNPINEKIAETAQNLNSFRDYKQGSATAQYKTLVAEFKTAVETLKKRANLLDAEREEKLELVDYYIGKYANKLANAINRENTIRASCPSVMICGPANFPTRKKEKQNAAMDKFWQECGDLFSPTDNYYFKKIENILLNKTIYSGDALAIEKLEIKLADLTEFQEEMKSANAYYRKNKTMKGYAELTDEEAEKLDNAIVNGYSWEQRPYPSYKLTNNNGKIKQTRDRLERLKAEKAMGDVDYDCSDLGFTVKENKEIMRLQLFFEGKPDEETRKVLKSNGFKWSPSQGAWQRQLTNNARWALKNYIVKQLRADF